jgi:hypothetical protein
MSLSFESCLRRTLVNVTSMLLILIGLMGCRRSLELGKLYDTWEASNDRFTVRVNALRNTLNLKVAATSFMKWHRVAQIIGRR